MKKKALSLLLVGAMAATLFAGCGSSSSDSNSSSGGSSSSTESSSSSSTSSDDSSSSSSSVDWDSIDVGSGDITIWAADNIADLTQTEADQFMADKGYDYTVTVEPVGEGDAASNVITDVEGAADIYGFAQDQLTRLVAAGAIQPLDDTFGAWVKDNNIDAAVDGVTVGDTLYAFPMSADNTWFMYYDKSVITDPTSLEQIVADCEAAGKNLYFNYDGWYAESFFFATGCTIEYTADDEGNYIDATIVIASDAGQVALQEMLDLSSSTSFQRSADAGSAVDYAVIMDGVWDENTISATLGDNMAATVLPSFVGSDGNTYTLKPFNGYKMYGIKPQTDAGKLKVCYELAQYLSDTDCQLDRFNEVGWGPSNLTALENDAITSDPVLGVVSEQFDWSVPQGVFPNEYWDIIKAMGDDAQNHTVSDDLGDYLQNIQDQLLALVS
ncbi:MAG: extracellular solute-binding protein [Clostridia bacterium]|nr:extracellular solute-binding protein [Clostridia bacterium]